MAADQPRPATDRPSAADPGRYCARCSPGLFRRINRTSWFQRTVLTWLGFFPWECVSCRRVRFFRDSGRKSRSRAAA